MPWASVRIAERRRELAGLEEDGGLFVVVAHFGVGRDGEGDDAKTQRRQTFGLATRLLGVLAADLGFCAQGLAPTLDIGLDDIDGFGCHPLPSDLFVVQVNRSIECQPSFIQASL